MSVKSQPKSKGKKFFNIDKESKKYYPNLGSSKKMEACPVYVSQKINRFEVRYRPMAA